MYSDLFNIAVTQSERFCTFNVVPLHATVKKWFETGVTLKIACRVLVFSALHQILQQKCLRFGWYLRLKEYLPLLKFC